jgi:hypothetical protein
MYFFKERAHNLTNKIIFLHTLYSKYYYKVRVRNEDYLRPKHAVHFEIK